MDAKIPEEFMATEIFNRLDVASWARCKAVCRRWRTALSGRPSPANQIPWLSGLYLEAPSLEIITNIFRNTIYTAKLPQQMLAKCVGSFGPWLILITDQLPKKNKKNKIVDVFLYNPFSSKRLTLPPIGWLDDDSCLVHARMSCLPNESNLWSNKFVVAVFIYDDIYVCKFNHKWKKLLYHSGHSVISDAVFHFENDKRLMLYLINYSGKITAVDLITSNIISSSEELLSNKGAYFKLVVDSSGELLVVEINKLSTIVRKLWQGRLMAVENLGGGMIFIGAHSAYYCSKAVSDSDFYVGDCVYSLDLQSRGYNGCCYVLSRVPMNQLSSAKTHELVTQDSVLWLTPMIT